jgi:hypothetical protein
VVRRRGPEAQDRVSADAMNQTALVHTVRKVGAMSEFERKRKAKAARRGRLNFPSGKLQVTRIARIFINNSNL